METPMVKFNADDFKPMDAPGELRATPLMTPFNQNINPFNIGMQMGMLGAAAGVGVAGIQRALRMRAGNTAPVSMYRPMVIGAVIGSALGTLGGYKLRKKLEVSQPRPPRTWDELGERLDANAEINKYAGLRHIVKRAQWAEAAQLPLYFVPYVGTALSARDTIGSLKNTVGSLLKGNMRGAAGNALGTLGNLGVTIATLFPYAGGIAKSLGMANRVTRGASAIKGIANVGRLGQLAKGSPELARAAEFAGGRLSPLWARLSPAAQRIPGKAITGMENVGQRINPLGRHSGKLGILGAGTYMAGQAVAAPRPGVTGLPRRQYIPRRVPVGVGHDRFGIALPAVNSVIPRYSMPQFEVPNVKF